MRRDAGMIRQERRYLCNDMFLGGLAVAIIPHERAQLVEREPFFAREVEEEARPIGDDVRLDLRARLWRTTDRSHSHQISSAELASGQCHMRMCGAHQRKLVSATRAESHSDSWYARRITAAQETVNVAVTESTRFAEFTALPV